jgi:urease accessory protein
MDACENTAAPELLAALQYADSFFPAGGVAFSWGLEQLRADREIGSPGEVGAFIEAQLDYRWAGFDAPALCAAWRAGEDRARLAEIDRLVEAMTLAAEMREGSRRAGLSLLSVHAQLGSAAASAYREIVMRGEAPGHLPVVQGLAWRAAGLGEELCRAVSAHTLLTAMVSAALRLGLIGHLQAQAVLNRLRPRLAGILSRPAGTIEEATTCTPAADIASMRHEVADARLFAN